MLEGVCWGRSFGRSLELVKCPWLRTGLCPAWGRAQFGDRVTAVVMSGCAVLRMSPLCWEFPVSPKVHPHMSPLLQVPCKLPTAPCVWVWGQTLGVHRGRVVL